MGSDRAGAIETLRNVLADPGSVAAAWKSRGGKVMGLRCLFVPEELIWAAGMLPYPLYGTPETVRLADAYFQSCTCEFVRNVFDHALEGKLRFLDGLALPNTCDVGRRLYDMWSRYIEGCPVYLINNPQKMGDNDSREYYLEEMDRFRSWTEGISGGKATDGKLIEAIDLYNETRTLLREIYAARMQDPPPLGGQEAFEIAMASSILPRDRANPLLRRAIEEIRGRKAQERPGPRILVTGSIIDHPALISMIEEVGGVVVADDLCTTTRCFWHLVERDGDPLDALYRHFNKRPLCACMHPQEARLDYVASLVDEFRVDAVIDFNLKYCHPFLYEAPLLKRKLEARGVSVSVLEVGHDMSGHGQLRTRIQAFIEMLEP
jgi:benzoyl-CoA reductase subunit C